MNLECLPQGQCAYFAGPIASPCSYSTLPWFLFLFGFFFGGGGGIKCIGEVPAFTKCQVLSGLGPVHSDENGSQLVLLKEIGTLAFLKEVTAVRIGKESVRPDSELSCSALRRQGPFRPDDAYWPECFPLSI